MQHAKIEQTQIYDELYLSLQKFLI